MARKRKYVDAGIAGLTRIKRDMLSEPRRRQIKLSLWFHLTGEIEAGMWGPMAAQLAGKIKYDINRWEDYEAN